MCRQITLWEGLGYVVIPGNKDQQLEPIHSFRSRFIDYISRQFILALWQQWEPNYRLLNLTSVSCKIPQKAFLLFLTEARPFSPGQHGCLPRRARLSNPFDGWMAYGRFGQPRFLLAKLNSISIRGNVLFRLVISGPNRQRSFWRGSLSYLRPARFSFCKPFVIL